MVWDRLYVLDLWVKIRVLLSSYHVVYAYVKFLIGKPVSFLKGITLLKMLSCRLFRNFLGVMWCLCLKVEDKKAYVIVYKVFCFLFRCDCQLRTPFISAYQFRAWTPRVKFWLLHLTLAQFGVSNLYLHGIICIQFTYWHLSRMLTHPPKEIINSGEEWRLRFPLRSIKLLHQEKSLSQST